VLIGYWQEKTIKKILLTSWIVKRKIALEKGLGFQAQIEDLGLKCRIHQENFRNKSTGRKTGDGGM